MFEDTETADLQLLSRYAEDGDQEAFALLVRRHWGVVMGACRREMGENLDPEDVAQVAFVRLASKSSLLLGRGDLSSLRGWLCRVAVCEARRQRVRLRARTIREQRVVQDRAKSASERTGQSKEREQILRTLDEAVLELPRQYREVIEGYYLDGRSTEELAASACCTEKVIRNRLFRGRKRLGELMSKRLAVTTTAVIGVLENLPKAPPISEGFIEQTVRSAMQIRQGLTPSGLNPNVTQLLVAKASWPLAKLLAAKGSSLTLAKILAGVSALVLCVAGGAVVTHQVLARRTTTTSATAPSVPAPVAPIRTGMVLIPGGTNAGADPDSGKPYSLTVESFLMDRCEVTKGLWDEMAAWGREHGYAFQAISYTSGSQRTPQLQEAGQGKAPDHPVHSVSWEDCVPWCNARSEKDGFMPVYYADKARTVVMRRTMEVLRPFVKATADGYRLPTLVEWQYAARGGEPSHRFPWHDNDTIDHTRANYMNPISHVWDKSPTGVYHPTYAVEPKPYTSPVGAFPANAYGLYDMAGNVSEWCADADGGQEMMPVPTCKFTGGSWEQIVPVHTWAYADALKRSLDRGFRTARTPRGIGAATH